MKKLIFFSILFNWSFISSYLYGQSLPIDSKSGLLNYSETIDSDASKTELHNRIEYWVENSCYGKEEFNVITNDKENGRIVLIINSTLSQNLQTSYIWWYNYKMTILIKDNKWKYELTKFYVHCMTSGGIYTSGSESKNSTIEQSEHFDITDLKKKNKNATNLNDQLQEIIKSLKEGMKAQYKKDIQNW